MPNNNDNEFFWDNDMTTVHDRRSWFGQLSARRRIIYLLLLLFVMCWCFFLGFSVVGAMQPDQEEIFTVSGKDIGEEEIAEVLELEGMRVIMLVGCDAREGETQSRSDTIMLAFLNMDDKTVSLVSIPRDSYVEIPGTGTKTKINAAFFYGGVSMTRSTLENLLGVTIDNYMLVDFQGFSDVVDALGGVDVDVDQRMYKPSENIDLQPGPQTLDGYGALAYCRYRDYADGDLGRIQHQQNFIRLLMDKLFSSSSVTKIPELVRILFKYVETDLNIKDCIEIGTYALQADMDQLNTYTVPGENKWLMEYSMWLSYQIILESELNSILTEILGDDVPFTTHVVTDNGTGRYSLPSDVEEPSEHADEEQPDVAEPPVIDPLPNEPGNEQPGGQTPDPGRNDDPGGIDDDTDVWDLPEP